MSTTQYANTQHPVDKAAHAEVKKEIHENQMHDPDQPLGTRAKAAAKVPGDKMEAEGHKHQPASAHPAAVPLTHGVPPVGPVTYPATAPGVGRVHPATAPSGPVYGVNQPTTHFGGGHQDPVHHPKAANAETKKEFHEAVAKDQDQPMGERVKAAVKVPADKVKEVGHKATPGKHYGVDHTHPEGSTNYDGLPTHGVHPITTPGVGYNAAYPAAAHGPATPAYPATAHGPTAAVGPHGVLPGGPTSNIQDPARHPKAVEAEAKKEMHEYQAQDPNQKAGTRAKAAAKIPGDKAKEVAHKTKPEKQKHYAVDHHPVVAGAAHPAHGVVGDPTTYAVHPISGVVGDPTTYAVHPHSGVNHPSGVGAYPAPAAEIGHKHQPATHIGSEPVATTTYAGNPIPSSHPPATKTPPSTPVAGTKHMEENMKVKEAEVKKEVHKQQATDSSNTVGERVKAAVKVPVDAVQVAEHKIKEKIAEKK